MITLKTKMCTEGVINDSLEEKQEEERTKNFNPLRYDVLR